MAESKWTGAGTGAVQGAGTGAMLGSVIPGVGTAIGAGVGAGVGALGGWLKSGSSFSEYDKKSQDRMRDLEARMNAGTLGLTDEERSLMESSAFQREQQARDIANAERDRRLASAYQGGGVQFAQMQQAEQLAIDEARLTGLAVAEADLEEAKSEESEYWGRLAANSAREQELAEKSAKESKEMFSDLNKLIEGEITGGGLGVGGGNEGADIAKQFGTEPERTQSAIDQLADNPDMLALLVAALNNGSE